MEQAALWGVFQEDSDIRVDVIGPRVLPIKRQEENDIVWPANFSHIIYAKI